MLGREVNVEATVRQALQAECQVQGSLLHLGWHAQEQALELLQLELVSLQHFQADDLVICSAQHEARLVEDLEVQALVPLDDGILVWVQLCVRLLLVVCLHLVDIGLQTIS